MRVHVCRFSAGLDELPRRKQGDRRAVLEVLVRAGRFSVFEACDNQIIASMMTRLMHGNAINPPMIRSTGGEFPWTNVELTEAGKAYLEAIGTPGPQGADGKGEVGDG